MIDWTRVFNTVSVPTGIAALLYGAPYLVRKGWGDAENRTKKVCDTCFRDIKKWNEAIKKIMEDTDDK